MRVHRRAGPVNRKSLITSSDCDVAVVEAGGGTGEASTAGSELWEEVADIPTGFHACVIESARVSCRGLLGKVVGKSVDTELSIGYFRSWERTLEIGVSKYV